MICDDVFDILTRGPFPTGGPIDGPVERHLARCDECRELAEALRPAVELFHEAVGAEESRDLPGYQGELAARSAAPSFLRTVAALPRRRRAIGSRVRSALVDRRVLLARFSVAALVAIVFFGATRGFVQPGPAAEQNYVVASACLDRAPPPWPLIEATSPRHLHSFTKADLANLHCCTDCHSSASKRLIRAADVSLIAMACGACHGE